MDAQTQPVAMAAGLPEVPAEQAWTLALHAVSTPLRFMSSVRDIQDLDTMGVLRKPLADAFCARLRHRIDLLRDGLDEAAQKLATWESQNQTLAKEQQAEKPRFPIQPIHALSEQVNEAVQEGLAAGLFEETVIALGQENWRRIARYEALRSVFKSVLEGRGLRASERTQKSVLRLQWLVSDPQTQPFWQAWQRAEKDAMDHFSEEHLLFSDRSDCSLLGHWIGELVTKMTRDERWIEPGIAFVQQIAYALQKEGPASTLAGPTEALYPLSRLGLHAASAIKFGYPRFGPQHTAIYNAFPFGFWKALLDTVAFSSRSGQWVVEQTLAKYPETLPDPTVLQLGVIAWKNLDRKGLQALDQVRPGLPEQALAHVDAQSLYLLKGPRSNAGVNWAAKAFKSMGADSNDWGTWAVQNKDKGVRVLQLLNASLQRQNMQKHLKQKPQQDSVASNRPEDANADSQSSGVNRVKREEPSKKGSSKRKIRRI